jgi:hypothetical protein
MSEVTNVLLAFSISEDADARLAEIDAFLDDHEQLPFASVWTTDAAVGGGKRMDAPLYAGAFNGFHVRRFVAFLRALPWADPEQVQVMVRAPREDGWQLIAV